MLVPNTIHDQIRTLTVIGGSAQRAEYRVVNRVFVRHLEHRRHHHLLALWGEVFRAAQNAVEVLRGAIYGVIHHHFSAVRETRHHICREVNLMSSRVIIFIDPQKYKNFITH